MTYATAKELARIITPHIHRYDATDHCVACGERRAPRLNIAKHEDAMVYVGAGNPNIAPPTESPADRILRVARAAGYKPRGVVFDGTASTLLGFNDGRQVGFYNDWSDTLILDELRRSAGPANQPAPKAMTADVAERIGDEVAKRLEEQIAENARGHVPGMYIETVFGNGPTACPRGGFLFNEWEAKG